MNNVHLIEHPLVQHKLTLLREAGRSTMAFRALVREIGVLLAYEALRDLPLQDVRIETPLEAMNARRIDGKKVVLVPILRAGLGLLDGMLEVVPSARVGHVGLYRDPDSLQAVRYYFKMPQSMAERDAVVLDPMLATGNSAVAALDELLGQPAERPRSVRFVCLVACPQGIATVHARHPSVPIFTAAIDRELDQDGYIRPGLGDAGDRIFGTK